MVRKKRNIFVENDNETGRSIPVIAEIDNNDIYKMSNEEEEHILPILPLRNMILFPSSILTVSVGRESSLKLVNSIGKSKDIIGVFCQTQADIENPRQEDLFQIGTTARLLRVFEMPDESTTIVLQGIERINLKSIITQKPFLKGSVTLRKDILPDALNEKENNETDSLIRTMREDAKTLFSLVEPTGELNIALNNIDDDVLFTNFLASNIRCDINEKYRLLSEDNFVERMYHLATVVYQELALAKLNHEIQKRTHMELDQQQREYFLQQQIKNIQEELGGGSVQGQDVQDLQEKAQNKKWNESTKELFEKEVAKLERINPQTPRLPCTAELPANVSQPAMGRVFQRQSGPCQCPQDIRPRPLRPRKGKRKNFGASGSHKTTWRPEIAHYMPVRPSGSGQDIVGKIHCRSTETQICSHVAGWPARRVRNSRTSQNIYRSHARTHNKKHGKSRNRQPRIHS